MLLIQPRQRDFLVAETHPALCGYFGRCALWPGLL